MSRVIVVAAGVLMVAVGVMWTLQGLGYLQGSVMSGQPVWALVGPVVAGLGVALVLVVARR